jgi:type II secretory ATPase GspE/PulE/Tfp pilus assembly ATPase PilB-like protein
VYTPTVADSSAAGFMAVPMEPSSPFCELFFYNHGVRREAHFLLGEMLVSQGLLLPEALDQAIEAQRTERISKTSPSEDAPGRPATIDRRPKRIGEVLTEQKMVSERDLSETLAIKFGMSFVDLDTFAIDPSAAAEVPRELIEKYGVLPIATSDRALTVAIGDPLSFEVIDILRLQVHRRIEDVLATPSQLRRYVHEYLSLGDEPTAAGTRQLDEILRKLADEQGGEEAEDDEEQADLGTDSGVISLVNQIILDAYRAGASDIHIEPNGPSASTVVRFRIDGECSSYKEIPGGIRSAVVARIKIMSKLDIAERRRPQDGKIRFRLPDRQIELRVATIPTAEANEDVVLRILAGSKPLELEKLRLAPRNLSALRRLIARPYGLLLCVGPTGSGKTTTLHSVLGALNTTDTKIWTAEDPIEIRQPGLRQVQVNPRIDFTFAHAMRSFLRADPDVIMIGEMRDPETAGVAVEASLTGHLVLSTLHTNTAPETVTRLLEMGLEPFSFSDALLGVLAQRLARALCSACREQTTATPEELELMAAAFGGDHRASGVAPPVWRARGCRACRNTGYKGRVGLHELLVADDTLKQALVRRAPVDEIRQLAVEQGMRTLLQDGIEKAQAGLTDLKQVLAVCSQ